MEEQEWVYNEDSDDEDLLNYSCSDNIEFDALSVCESAILDYEFPDETTKFTPRGGMEDEMEKTFVVKVKTEKVTGEAVRGGRRGCEEGRGEGGGCEEVRGGWRGREEVGGGGRSCDEERGEGEGCEKVRGGGGGREEVRGGWRGREEVRGGVGGRDVEDAVTAVRSKSSIIRLDTKRKFCYVPDTLPEVELPELARKKHKRSPAKQNRFNFTKPTLLLEPQLRDSGRRRRNAKAAVDLRSVLLRKQQQQYTDPFNTDSPETETKTADVEAVASLSTASLVPAACDSSSTKPPTPNQSPPPFSCPSPDRPSSHLPTTLHPPPFTTSQSSSLISTPSHSSPLTTPHSSPAHSPLHFHPGMEDFDSVPPSNSIFAFRPSFFSRAPPGQFSLEHLISPAPARAAFSLDHLRSC